MARYRSNNNTKKTKRKSVIQLLAERNRLVTGSNSNNNKGAAAARRGGRKARSLPVNGRQQQSVASPPAPPDSNVNSSSHARRVTRSRSRSAVVETEASNSPGDTVTPGGATTVTPAIAVVHPTTADSNGISNDHSVAAITDASNPCDTMSPANLVDTNHTIEAVVHPTVVLNPQVPHTLTYPAVNPTVNTDPVADTLVAPHDDVPPLNTLDAGTLAIDAGTLAAAAFAAANVPPARNILLNNYGTAHESHLLNLDSNVPCLEDLKDEEYTKKLLYTLSFRATSAFSNLVLNFPGSKYAKRNLVGDYLMFLNFAATVTYFHNHDYTDSVSEMSVSDYARQHDMYFMTNNNNFISYKQQLHDAATYSKIWYGSVKNTSLEVYLKPRITRQRIMYSYSIPWRVHEFSNKKEHNDRNKFKCFSGWLPVFQQLKYAFWKY